MLSGSSSFPQRASFLLQAAHSGRNEVLVSNNDPTDFESKPVVGRYDGTTLAYLGMATDVCFVGIQCTPPLLECAIELDAHR